MELSLFEQVGELTRSLVPPELGEFRHRAHRSGVKVWFDSEKPPRDHFEAQIVPRRLVDGADGAVIEVGFHAEEREADVNDATLTTLMAHESGWRDVLGREPQVGEFLGHNSWRRVSEVWLDVDLDVDDPDLAFELASRLADYVTQLQPHLPRT